MNEYKPDKPVSKRLSDSQSLKAAECPKCKEVFTSVAMFDKHLKRVNTKIDNYKMICTDPATSEMEIGSRGYWTIPQSEENAWWK